MNPNKNEHRAMLKDKNGNPVLVPNLGMDDINRIFGMDEPSFLGKVTGKRPQPIRGYALSDAPNVMYTP